MLGFESLISGVRSSRSANHATTTVLTFTHLLHYAGVINFSILEFYAVVLPILASTSQRKLYVPVSIFCRGKRRRRLNATLICLSIIHSFPI